MPNPPRPADEANQQFRFGGVHVRFSPDKSMVFFTSNMFGPAYVIGVEVDKALNPKPDEVIATPELARKYNPRNPEDTHAIAK